MWLVRPIIVLTNRSTFSAANNFVMVMKQLPNVTVVGATTGGGSGMPLSAELKCGWGVRMSAAPILDANKQTTEFGIEPTEGCAVDITADDEAAGRDTILDFALRLLTTP
jgi:C-terminal processing protease CtpA/Prc